MKNSKTIIKTLSDQGVELYLDNDKLKARALKGAMTAQVNALIRTNKASLIEYLSASQPIETARTKPSIEKLGKCKEQLSFAQQRLWFIDRFQGGSPEYNMPSVFEITGDFDADVVQQALQRVVERHEVIRTVYFDDGDSNWQQVKQDLDLKLCRYDLSDVHSEELKKKKLQLLIEQDKCYVFDLTKDLMMRASYIKLNESSIASPAKGVMLFNMHHIASDGWSMDVLVKEFVIQYDAASKGQIDPMPPLEIQYCDYAAWQKKWLPGEALESQLDYWQRQLKDIPPVHSLPTDKARPKVKENVGASIKSGLPQNVSEGLQRIAKVHNLTLFMVLHAALALVLSRHSNSHDIVIGSPFANRLEPGLDKLIGFFVNPLVLRLDTDFEQLGDFLSHVRQVNLDAQSNQDVPFEQIVERLNIERNNAHTPLFQIMLTTSTDFGLPNTKLDIPGISFKPLQSEFVSIKWDLNIYIDINDDGVSINFNYDVGLFEHESMLRLNEHLMNMLTSMADSQRTLEETNNTLLTELSICSKYEMHHLLFELNNTDKVFDKQARIHELFEVQVNETPGSVAIVSGEDIISYDELNKRANQLANVLLSKGIIREMLVGICLKRGPEFVVSILAVLKAGATYVPIDPSYPADRVEFITQDALIDVVLCERSTSVQFSAMDTSSCIVLDDIEISEELKRQDQDNLHVPGLGSDLAYIIYTSGSTGKPKGVMVEHRNLVAYQDAFIKQIESLNLQAPLRWMSNASFSFDASLKNIIVLLQGGQISLLNNDDIKDVSKIIAKINEHQVNVYNAVPQMLNEVLQKDSMFIERGPALISSGDTLSEDTLARLSAYSAKHERICINAYGPTETTINSSFAVISDNATIGYPVPNTQFYIVDEHGQILPKGSKGELWIGGAGVTRGYLNRDDLTSQSFIDNPFEPFASAPQHKLYKTGDLVSYRPDGSLAFWGRIDQQVKIRGFRIELSEIESVICTVQGVYNAVVIQREAAGEKQLVACIVVEAEITNTIDIIETVLEEVSSRLPHYMVPSLVVAIDSIPLSATGKVDRKLLLDKVSESTQVGSQNLSTATQQQLAAIWKELLGLLEVGVNSNFFELGGHSLLAIRLSSEIGKVFNLDVGLLEIFEYNTLQSMAKYIDELSKGCFFENETISALDDFKEEGEAALEI